MRDTLGGFPVRDLDFTVEGSALKLAKLAEKKFGAKIVSTDDHLKSVDLLFPGGVTAELAMARQETFAKSGARPQITPATIHEDLRCRDFTVNAIALSLNKASLGLLIDPTNGIGDIERKELRTIHNYSFYDAPERMLRLIRFKARLGYAIDERTRAHYENAREAEMLGKITTEALGAELRKMAEEPNAGDLIEGLEQEKLLDLYSSALAGAKTNLPAFQKLQKARQMAPVGVEFKIHPLPLFLNVLFEKLNAKERADLIKTRRPDQSGNHRLAKTGRRCEETRARFEERQTPESLAAISSDGERPRRSRDVSGAPLPAAHRAGPHQELLPEAPAGLAGDHQRNSGRHRRGRRDPPSSKRPKSR